MDTPGDHSLYTSKPPTPVSSEVIRDLNLSTRTDAFLSPLRTVINRQDFLPHAPFIQPSSESFRLVPQNTMTEIHPDEEPKSANQSNQQDCEIPSLKLKYFNVPSSDPQENQQGCFCDRTNPEPCLCYTRVVIQDDIFGEQQVIIGFANIVHDGFCDRNLFHLQIVNQSLAYIPSVLINSKVTSLNISCNSINSLSDLCAPNLLMLNASRNKLKVFSDIVNTPIALRCIDVSYNQITEVYNLEKLWALSELNLSYNNLDKIETLENLDNLILLNLSHNKLTKVGSISCKSLRFLLIHNNLLRTAPDVQGSPKLRMLSLEHNKLEDLTSLEFAYNVNELHLEGNNIEDINQLRHLKPLMSLYHLWVQPNPLMKVSMYRNVIIFMLPTLLTLDGVRLKAIEKVESRNLFNPSIHELSFRDRIECILDQAPQSGNVQLDNFLFQRPLPPILLLVGEPMGRSFKISASLKVRLRDQVHLGGVHSTVTTLEFPDSIHAQDIPVSFEIFEGMKSRGEFIAKSHILGRICGFSSSQILQASEKCCLLVAAVPLGIALSLRNSGITAKTILILPPSQEQVYSPSPVSSKETLAALVACETNQDLDNECRKEQELLANKSQVGADGQPALPADGSDSSFREVVSADSQNLSTAVSFKDSANEIVEFTHLDEPNQSGDYSKFRSNEKKAKCEPEVSEEQEQPKDARTLLFPPSEMISLTFQCRKSVSGMIATSSNATSLKISLNNPDPACETNFGETEPILSSLFKKDESLELPNSSIAEPQALPEEPEVLPDFLDEAAEDEEEQLQDHLEHAPKPSKSHDKPSFFTNLSLCVYTPSGHHQCCMNLKPYDASEKHTINHGIFFFPEGRRNASKKNTSGAVLDAGLGGATISQESAEVHSQPSVNRNESNQVVNATSSQKLLAQEAHSSSTPKLAVQDVQANSTPKLPVQAAPANSTQNLPHHRNSNNFETTPTDLQPNPSTTSTSSKRTSFSPDTDFHDTRSTPLQLEAQVESQATLNFDGSVIHPKPHSHQVLQNIVKIRQEYVQFHEDNPGFFHVIVNHANTEMCILECLQIAQSMLEESAGSCQNNTTEEANLLNPVQATAKSVPALDPDLEAPNHIELGLEQIRAAMGGQTSCF